MLELDTPDDVRPLPGRHRVTPSLARKVVVRGSAGASGVLIAALLGWTAAAALGLTGTSPIAGGSGAVPGSSEHALADPTFRRTVDITGTPTDRTEEAAVAAPEVASRAERPASTSTADTAPAPGPEQEAAPAPVQPPPTVRPGDPCPAEGISGTTARGRPTVCTATRGDRLRWRHA